MNTNTTLGNRLRLVIDTIQPRLVKVSEEESAQKPRPEKWSKKEILGHLIDSAANNHPRFVRARMQDNLLFDSYAQEDWVNIQQYQQVEWQDIITLWYAFNHHIAHVMDVTPEDVLHKQHKEHNYRPLSYDRTRTIETASLADWMIDYIDHLEHHLQQIFPDYKSPEL